MDGEYPDIETNYVDDLSDERDAYKAALERIALVDGSIGQGAIREIARRALDPDCTRWPKRR